MKGASAGATELAPNLAAIAEWIAPESSVLDLGCGDGSLLAWLKKHKGCRGIGVEIDDAKLLACVKNGVEVIQLNLEDGLALFTDQSFDTVLQLETLQMVMHTEGMLRELRRVGHESIITFPNFGFWTNRLSIALGRMPVTRAMPYEWFDTPNLRFATFADVRELAQNNGFTLRDRFALRDGRVIRVLPNLFGSVAVFRLVGQDPNR